MQLSSAWNPAALVTEDSWWLRLFRCTNVSLPLSLTWLCFLCWSTELSSRHLFIGGLTLFASNLCIHDADLPELNQSFFLLSAVVHTGTLLSTGWHCSATSHSLAVTSGSRRANVLLNLAAWLWRDWFWFWDRNNCHFKSQSFELLK